MPFAAGKKYRIRLPGQVVDFHKGNLRGFLENDPSIFNLAVFLVELSELNPQILDLSHGLLRVHSLNSLSVRGYHLK